MKIIDAEAEESLDLRAEVGLGAWLLRLRVRSGLTQGQLAQAAGVSQRNIQRWEADQNAPGGYELLRVLDALGVRLAEFDPPGSVNTELRHLRETLEHRDPNWSTVELAVVTGIANGQKDRDIGERLGLTQAEVKAALRSATTKTAASFGLPEPRFRESSQDPLRALEAKVAELPTADDLGNAVATLQAAIDRLAIAGSPVVQQEKPAGKSGAR